MENHSLLSLAFHILSRIFKITAEQFSNFSHDVLLNQKGVAIAKQIKTHMSRRELNTLYDLALRCGSSAKVLEIGSYVGASSCYLAAALAVNNGHLFCVDTWENQTMAEGEYDTFSEFSKNTKTVSEYISSIRKNSQSLLFSDIEHPLNLVFIDGDHSYSTVNKDYKRVTSWIVEGGFLVFHDCIHFEGVSRTIGEALASGNWQLIGHVDNLLWLRKIGRQNTNFTHPIELETVLTCSN